MSEVVVESGSKCEGIKWRSKNPGTSSLARLTLDSTLLSFGHEKGDISLHQTSRCQVDRRDKGGAVGSFHLFNCDKYVSASRRTKRLREHLLKEADIEKNRETRSNKKDRLSRHLR